RIADVQIDTENPRTKMRALPAGVLSETFVVLFVVASCVIFVVGAAELNRLTLYLSPVALAVILLYSYTKRCTRWSHLVLGFALGAIAVAGIVVVGLLLAYEQSLVHENDLSRLNAAFFTMNGVIAVVFFIFVSADILMRR